MRLEEKKWYVNGEKGIKRGMKRGWDKCVGIALGSKALSNMLSNSNILASLKTRKG